MDTQDLPILQEGLDDQTFDEIELLGFPLSSPFNLVENLVNYDCILAKHLAFNHTSVIRILGYYVCKKEVRTVRGKRMAFGTWIDPEGRFFDTTHFAYALTIFPL